MASIALNVPLANGSGTTHTWKGGWATIHAKGTAYDGGTFTLQVSWDSGTTYHTLKDDFGDNVAFAANGYKNVTLGGFPLVRVTLAGAAASANTVAIVVAYGWAPTRGGER
jgi:hypothetical protein